MNPNLEKLQPYPFEKLRGLFAEVSPNPELKPISLSIGEPKHPTPEFIKRTLTEHLAGLASYPATAGRPALRTAIAAWLEHRYGLEVLNSETQVLPVNGSREALFAIAQTVVDPRGGDALVVCPNPFYQIYEGAALLAGATPYYVNQQREHGFALELDAVPDSMWRRVQLFYTCSPGNPTGRVMPLDEWRRVFELSDRWGFVVVSDECYSELYLDEARPPLGALEAARQLGRTGFPRLVVLSSLSKRSNAPGLRSGFAAGDAAILKKFLLYRTYHGSAMNPAVQAASEAAWRDETHVAENRTLYRVKFEAALPLIAAPLATSLPDGGFYFWIRTPISDIEFARALHRDYNVAVLPGSFLAREAHGVNPGRNHVRVALVAPYEECLDGMDRIRRFAEEISE
jgi:N-succinyldiaminopimelate aminotransferase